MSRLWLGEVRAAGGPARENRACTPPGGEESGAGMHGLAANQICSLPKPPAPGVRSGWERSNSEWVYGLFRRWLQSTDRVREVTVTSMEMVMEMVKAIELHLLA